MMSAPMPNPESEHAYQQAQTHAQRDRERILLLAQQRGLGGITVEEAEHRLGLKRSTCSARCAELKADGLLMPSERRRHTDSGSWGRVLVFVSYDNAHKVILATLLAKDFEHGVLAGLDVDLIEQFLLDPNDLNPLLLFRHLRVYGPRYWRPHYRK
jgi:hypothetical protein